MLLKDKQMLKSVGKKKRQRTVRVCDLHVVKHSHLGSWELISARVCVPHPLQCQAGPPLWLQKISSIPSFISHYNALGSWTRSFSATHLAQQCFSVQGQTGISPCLLWRRNTLRFPRGCLTNKQFTCMRMDSQDLSALSNPVLILSRSLHFGEKGISINL